MDDPDYLKASDGNGNAVLANITADRAIASTVIEVDNVDNWPDKFIVTTGVLDVNGYITDESKTEMSAHLEGGDIVIDDFEPGYSDTGNVEDQVAIIKQTTGWANRVKEFISDILERLLVSINLDGTLKDDSVTEDVIEDDAVTAAKLDNGAIKLAYVKKTSNFASSATSATQITGLTADIDIPDTGGRDVEIELYTPSIDNDSTNQIITISIWDGVVGSGTQLNKATGAKNAVGGHPIHLAAKAVLEAPAAGAKTINAALHSSGGQSTVIGAATSPSFLLIKIV